MVKKENVLFDAGVQMTPFWSFSLLSVHSPSTPWQNEKWMNAWEVSTVARVPLSLQIIFISNFFECVFRSHFFFCCRNFISYKNILFFRITFAKGRRAGDSIRDAGGKMYSLELIRAPGTPHHRSDELMHEGDGRRCIAMLSLVMVGWVTRILPVILHTQLLHRPPSIRHNAIQ